MVKIGIKGREELTVTEAQSAEMMGSGTLSVFATPAMIALVEKTAWKSIKQDLEPGQTTVGTRVDMGHVSASPIGMKVWAETELIEIDRNRLVFDVKVCDEKGVIGEGNHERYIVDADRFMSKASAKLEG